ncbi:MT-A70 family methyltransferase, partial [Chloroflexota bacterium]
LSLEEYKGLEESLIKEGNRVPIDTWQGYIVDGHNRYDICHKHNIALKPANELPFKDRDDVLEWIINNQLSRRNLAISIRLDLVIIRNDIRVRRDTKERQANSGPGIYGGKPLPQTFGEAVHDAEADAIIGKEAGVSRETVRKYRKVKEKATPDQKAKLSKGDKTINQIYKSLHLEEIREITKNTIWPSGKYRVIYADPPWNYGNNMPIDTTTPDDYYPTENIEILKQRPVNDLALTNAVLYLWSTAPMLSEALQLIESWGFVYKTCFVWDKIKHNMGHYNSVRHELLLVAVKGSCQPDVLELFDSVQSIERNGPHSRKPARFREIIDTNYPYGPRIELFATEKIEGWDRYGYGIS